MVLIYIISSPNSDLKRES